MIIDIDHINIVVSDLNESEAFFSKLGFHKTEGVVGSILEGDWISEIVGLQNVSAEYISMCLPGSNINIELIKYYSPASDAAPLNNKANTLGIRHIALKTKDIDAEISRLQKLGISFYSKAVQKGSKRLVYFEGPDNIIIELAEYL
ncbi:VOC family protein [Lentisphaerota bacterium ZTH]|nr:VOC family protein [Lentisphaerota bacterium]WET05340.1 VOC family protein [Lentisphaerota bacterium ZTH]